MCQENQHIIAAFQKVTSEVERAIMSTNLLSARRINPTLHQLRFHFSKRQKLKVNCQFWEVLLKATRAHSYIFFHRDYNFLKADATLRDDRCPPDCEPLKTLHGLTAFIFF